MLASSLTQRRAQSCRPFFKQRRMPRMDSATIRGMNTHAHIIPLVPRCRSVLPPSKMENLGLPSPPVWPLKLPSSAFLAPVTIWSPAMTSMEEVTASLSESCAGIMWKPAMSRQATLPRMNRQFAQTRNSSG